MPFLEAEKSVGYKINLKVDGVLVNHGYASRQLADDADKAIGQIWVRAMEANASESIAVGDYMVDDAGTTLNGVYMTAPLTPTTQLVYTIYPGAEAIGSNVNWQVEIKISFPDPADSSKRINDHFYDTFTVTNNRVGG